MRKRVICCLLAALLWAGPFAAAPLGAAAAQVDAMPAVSAQSAIVLDGATGRVLYEKNADAVLPMASTTKIMTAIVAIEGFDLDHTYTVKRAYTLAEGSSMYLQEGQRLTLRDTLYGLLLASGNDAALAIAGECGGAERFVAAMNDKALALGLCNTHFDNPSGLDGPNHHTTARELAALAAYAMQNPTFRQIVGTQTYTTAAGHSLRNHNRLLWQYDGAIGVKTGYTMQSGRCLVSAAERHGRRLIAVTLNDRNDWADHAALLDAGFDQFSAYTLHEAGDHLGAVACEGGTQAALPLLAQSACTAWLTAGEYAALTPVLLGRPFVYAPAGQNDAYGAVEYRVSGVTLARDTLVFGADSQMLPERKGFLQTILEKLRALFAGR